jgi:2-polyprenyl-3-methyl-5-hydroxy-6-metoxy-1,4-benzoquinol methylase
MTALLEEQRHLDRTASVYGGSVGDLNRDLTSAYTWRLVEQHANSRRPVLLLGLGDGYIAGMLTACGIDVLVVEGSTELVQNFHPPSGCVVVQSLFESFQPPAVYPLIVGTHILEHVDDPVQIIRQTTKWLAPSGMSIFTVPNRTSLHRRIGVKMGLLTEEDAFSEQDLALGHRRVFSAESLESDLRTGGYRHIDISGYNLKLVPNRMMATWDQALLDAIFELSREMPVKMCADLLAICRK